MDMDLTLAVFASSAAGMLFGMYTERQKARAAFKRMMGRFIESSTSLGNACMAVMVKRFPEANVKDLLSELQAECKAQGMEVSIVPAGRLRSDSNDQA